VAAAAVAMAVAARELAGEDFARRAAPFLVVAPAAVWHTNADVVFGGIALGGLALLVLACGRRGRASDWRALLGGALLGLSLLFSHGLALMALPALAVVVHRRRLRPALLAGAAALAVVLLPLAWGYWWIAGLSSTKTVYDLNLARVRPYGYFFVANLAAFAVAVGPATAVALTRLRSRGAWVLVAGGLAAVLAADVSGMSLAETERIWQPFMPMVLVAGGALAVGRASRGRGWLGLQAVVTVLLVAWLRSPW
jgi:4-amino-4-deoxy-L-arabinose transferase-like glycosyltransferase